MTYEVAQELANDTLLVVCNTFDPDRGNLKAFSTIILKNKIRNYVRRIGLNEILIDDVDLIDFENPENILLNQEKIMKLRKYFDALRSKLDDEELRFFITYEETPEVLESRAVSETARKLGINPVKGHNIMRRIVRKAESLRGHELIISSCIIETLLRPAVSIINEREVINEGLITSIAKFENKLFTYSFEDFWQNLSTEQKLIFSSF